MNDIFIPHIGVQTSTALIDFAKEQGFSFFGTYKNKTVSEIVDDFYKYNHGNSKMLWHFFYNNITGKYEITTTSRTVKNTYPQLKSVPITANWSKLLDMQKM